MISCFECKYSQCTKSHRLQAKVGFCQFTCQSCRSTNSTKLWRCPCVEQWRECEMHVQQKLLLHSLGCKTVHSVPKRGVKRFCTVRGIEQPKPQSRKHFDFNMIAITNSAAPILQSHVLELGSVLAARFPHHVNM